MEHHRYAQIAALLIRQIRNGTLRPGSRIPSLRQASRSFGVNPLTVMQAYQLLESRGWIETRPQSGSYVRHHHPAALPVPAPTPAPMASLDVDISTFIFSLMQAGKDPDIVPLGSAFPDPTLFPLERLARCLGRAARRMDPRSTITDLPPGNALLRGEIARRYLDSGLSVDPDEIVICNGAMEALGLSLQAVTQPGDLVAVESPAFYGTLQCIERLRLKAIEIPTDPATGIDPDALGHALARFPVKACWLMPNFQNPTGSLMPDAHREIVARRLAEHGVPLIEDDVYGELHFDSRRPRSLRAYSEKLDVLHCASFSKSLAPGYRVGWVIGGRHAAALQRLKFMSTLATNIPAQAALADYLGHGGIDSHLRKLRAEMAGRQHAMSTAIARHFPAGTRITQPAGGYFLWVELPEGLDTLSLHGRALQAGISIAPGPMFSAAGGWQHHLRLNTAQCTAAQADGTIRRLAALL